MKKSYETPSIEVVKFQYRDQVVVASGVCSVTNEVTMVSTCKEDSNPIYSNQPSV